VITKIGAKREIDKRRMRQDEILWSRFKATSCGVLQDVNDAIVTHWASSRGTHMLAVTSCRALFQNVVRKRLRGEGKVHLIDS